MANKPFEYTIINPLERPTSTDINQLQAQAHYDLRQFAYEIFGRQNGFLGYSFNPEPNSPADGTFYIQQGVAFQYGAAENSFGSPTIPGLVDSYQQKAVTTINRQITAEPVPAGAGEKRYDLLMIRAPASDERLTNSQNVGIYNPTLGTFSVSATSKYKTLTSSLDEFTIESITSVQTPTTPIVYKSGNVFTGAWDPVNKPSVNVGYLGVAYIQRYEGQTEIVAGDIEDARTLLTVPAMAGGSGASSVGDAGAIAYSNGTNLEFIRATLFGVPQTGRILVSGGAAAPTWLASAVASSLLVSAGANNNPTWITPGTVGQVLISDGAQWSAGSLSQIQTHDFNETKYTTTTYQEVASFTATAIEGAARIGIQSQKNSDTSDLWAWNQDIGNDGYVWLKFEVQKTGSFIIDYYLVKYTVHGPASGVGYVQSLAFPTVTLSVASGDYDVRLYVKSPPTSALNIQTAFLDCALFFAQG